MKKNSISTELKSARAKLGFTQLEMAKALGVPYRTLQDWLYGTRIPKPLTQEGIRNRLKNLLSE